MKLSKFLTVIILFIMFASCNSNNNLQPIDYAYAMKDNFNTIDSNKDNYITLQEAQAVIPGLDKETFFLMDYNGDKQLSQEEIDQFINENKTCGSTLRRGISCASQQVENWITDFITLLFSIAVLWYIPGNRK
jgi:hypothetical protein